jgi:2-methylcitrate dehydratase PrpD
VSAEVTVSDFVTTIDPGSIPPSAASVVRKVVLSTCATGVAGAGEDGVGELRNLLRERGGRGEATSLVFGDKLPATSASLLNGTMCRALDFCDAMAPGVHIGSSVVPAALAAAEAEGGCAGGTFFAAVAAGAEVGARFNLTEQMYDGFDPTGIAAVFAATAAASRVMGLDGGRTRDALALAFNRCGGSFQSHIDGSLAVRLQQGLAARAGVECAQFAGHGLTGPSNFLEGRYGYPHLYGRGLLAPADLVTGIGAEWRLTGFMFKRFPSCGATQGVTQQALDVTAELDLHPDDVDRVVVGMTPYCHRLVGHQFTPGTNPRVSAQFSVQYCVANAIARRSATLAHFRPEMVTDPELEPLMARVDVIADEAMDARGHSSVDFTLTTTDGRKASRSYDVSPGYPGRELSDAEHRERFDDCMSYAPYPLEAGHAAELRAAIDRLDELDDACSLLPLLVSAAARGAD